MSTCTLIETAQLAEMKKDTVLILDCRFELADTARGRKDYERAHIPGAIYADLDTDLSGPGQALGLGRHPLPTPEHLAATLTRWGWDGTRPVIAYDDGSGAIAARAWFLLRLVGFDKASVLDGGWQAWQTAGLPEDSQVPTVQETSVKLTLDLQNLVTTMQLQSQLHDQSCLLLDARARERYAGEVEPLDPVAGHVPHARNRPFKNNLDANGHFRDKATLREEFSRLLGDYQSEQVVHMCGSGVTACHNLLAMEHAGLHGSRLYAPSWSGWISDPERPVARSIAE